MTQNEVNIIKNAVLDATEAYVDARLSVADFVKTQIGVTSGNPVKRNNKYYHTVICNKTSATNGVIYNNVLSVGNLEFPNGSVVFLIAPNGQFSNQFILGKLDDTTYRIDSIAIGGTADNPAFKVDKQGNLTIGGGTFTVTKDGYMTANTGTFKGSITGGSININNRFIVDSNGNVTASYITATGGRIANFIINSTQLTNGDSVISQNTIGCGEAGNGLSILVGGRGGGDARYGCLQLSNSGSPNYALDGVKIYGNGKIERYGGGGGFLWDRYLSNIPVKTIYEDENGFLHWA